MKRIRRSGTDVELRLRTALWSSGLRYRLHWQQKFPGTPDLLFPSAKLAIFVDGCFWHGCPLHGTQPKRNSDFWREKIERNKRRDARISAEFSKQGWQVIRFWAHEVIRDIDGCVQRITSVVRQIKSDQ